MTMNLSDYAKQVDVTCKTAWQWWKAGHVEAYPLPTGTISVRDPHTAATGDALSARVSAADQQQDDALRQLQCRRDYVAARGSLVVAKVIESASGLSDERPKLSKVLTNLKVGVIVVEHRDRLTRFGYGYIATLLAHHGRRVEALYPSDTRDGLVADFVAVITSLVSRIYGRRTSERRAERIRACRACGEHVLHREGEGA
jgi:putative resolvase